MAHRENPEDPFVRINVFLPESERTDFDKWCRYGAKPRTSMTWRIRELIRADMAGKLHVPRTRPQMAKNPAIVPTPAPKRRKGK